MQFAGCAVALVTARLAQSAERKAFNLVVVGSSPTVGAFRRPRTHSRNAAHTTAQVHKQTNRCTPTHGRMAASTATQSHMTDTHAIHIAALACKLTLAGLEPAIFGSEDQRLIH